MICFAYDEYIMAPVFSKIVFAGVLSAIALLTFPHMIYAQLNSSGTCTGSIQSGGATTGSVQFTSSTPTVNGTYNSRVLIRNGHFTVNTLEFLADPNYLNGSSATFYVNSNNPASGGDDFSTGVVVTFSYTDWLDSGLDDHKAYVCNKLQNVPLQQVTRKSTDTDIRPKLNADKQAKTSFRLGENATFVVENVKKGYHYSTYWEQDGVLDCDDCIPDFTGEKDGGQSFSFTMPTDGGSYQQRNLCVTITGNPEKSCIVVTLSELPTIDYDKQASCMATVGEPITFTATNLIPGKSYHWYFTAAVAHSEGSVTPYSSDPTTAQFKVVSQSQEKERVCINFKGDFRDEGTNCIDFINTANAASYHIDCKQLNTPESQRGPTPKPPLPPCAAKLQRESGPSQTPLKCEAVTTGLGITLWTDPEAFVKSIFAFLLSISGGILLALIIYSGYQMMTSRGDPERIKAAQERITSAIVGFLFLVFSVMLLEIIGVNILRLPGFCGDNDSDCQKVKLAAPTPVPTIQPTQSVNERTSGPR
jgi:hypothetical protein